MSAKTEPIPSSGPIAGAGKIRILSDLHLGHPGSIIKAPEDLFPVLAGADHIVFNGDTIEEYANRYRPRSEELWAGIANHLREEGISFQTLTGNHDPTLGETHRLDLLDGDVLVTHGDFLFRYVSPWSGKADVTRSTLDRIIAETPPGHADNLDERLELVRKLSRAMASYQRQGPQGMKGRLLTLWRAFWPPSRPWRILGTWFQTPALAAGNFSHYCPDKKFLIMGHTHKAFIHDAANGQTVINTGAFYALSRPLVVDLEPASRSLRVFKVVPGEKAFVIGPQLRHYHLEVATAKGKPDQAR